MSICNVVKCYELFILWFTLFRALYLLFLINISCNALPIVYGLSSTLICLGNSSTLPKYTLLWADEWPYDLYGMNPASFLPCTSASTVILLIFCIFKWHEFKPNVHNRM